MRLSDTTRRGGAGTSHDGPSGGGDAMYWAASVGNNAKASLRFSVPPC